MPIFVVFGLTQSWIEPESTALVADALSTWPLIVLIIIQDDFFGTARITYSMKIHFKLLISRNRMVMKTLFIVRTNQ